MGPAALNGVSRVGPIPLVRSDIPYFFVYRRRQQQPVVGFWNTGGKQEVSTRG